VNDQPTTRSRTLPIGVIVAAATVATVGWADVPNGFKPGDPLSAGKAKKCQERSSVVRLFHFRQRNSA
jgi:hypothetical protein